MKPYYFLLIFISVTFVQACKNKDQSASESTSTIDTVAQTAPNTDTIQLPDAIDTTIQAPVEVPKAPAPMKEIKKEAPKPPANPSSKKQESQPTTVNVPAPKEIKISSGTKKIPTPTTPNEPSKKPDKPVQVDVIKSTVPIEKPSDAKPEHGPWNSLLQKYVSASGKVNYAAWKKDRSGLDNYIKSIASIDLNKLAYKEKLAYCINSYNAHTVQLVLDNYPTTSIQKLEGGKPWDKRFVKSGNTYYSLNELENKIIRPMGDARIHFALNCGAKSCPKLTNQAFTADNVTSLLEKVTRDFINSAETKISEDKVTISKIFEWYKADFDDVIAFLQKYTTVKINPDAKIAYTDYNWSLNE